MTVARSQEHAVDIDLHDPAPVLGSHVYDAAAAADPDIIVEAIEPAEPLQRRGDHGASLPLVGDVGDKGGGGSAFGCDHRERPLGPLALDIDDQHPGASTR